MSKKIHYPPTSTYTEVPCCPFCFALCVWRHGHYIRKSFYDRNEGSPSISCVVQRFLCRNPRCAHQTFSVLPNGVIPYCRFLWSDLLRIHKELSNGVTPYQIAKKMFGVDRSVISRVRRLLNQLGAWAMRLYRECSDGGTISELGSCIQALLRRYDRTVLRYLWVRHHYKFCLCQGKPT